MARRKYRTLNQIDEAYYRKHPDRLDSYLQTVFEVYAKDGDTSSLLSSLRMVARVKGISSLARESDITHNGIQKALSEKSKPRFDTISAIVNAMGYDITVQKHSS